ncbi:MAG: M61 family metallopeptidase [Pseudomonadota bacterium]
MISYRVQPIDLHAHQFEVTLTVPAPATEQQLSLPVWIPGSYLVREFARHLSQLAARQGTRPVALEQLGKTTWRARCSGRSPLVVSYRVYAFDNSVRTAWLDAQRGFFNGTSLCLRVHGREDEPHRLQLAGLPRGWAVATAMQPVDGKALAYECASYDELIDHPVELGPFWRGDFTVRGVPHAFVVAGAWPGLDAERLLADARKICEAQMTFWHGRGKPPFDRYVFMLNAVDDGYGGLEHRASTALIASRRDLPRKSAGWQPGDGYITLLGLISHEYFHTWNVKRLKPSEFAPYDLTRENPTRLLWFFEGLTSYYDDLLLRRAGLIDDARYLQLLGKTASQVLATPGRRVQSVAEASFDAWTKYYRPDENTANATVSYYTKGALVGLCFDLTLRAAGGSLDGAMRSLWALKRPITEADIRAAFVAEAGRPLDDEFAAWVHGRDELPLEQLLAAVGVSWQVQKATPGQALGLRTSESAGSLKVQAVMRASVAERTGLAAGDELIAIDGWRLRKADDLGVLWQAGRASTWLVARDQRLLTLHSPADAAAGSGAINLGWQADATAEHRAAARAWLDGR